MVTSSGRSTRSVTHWDIAPVAAFWPKSTPPGRRPSISNGSINPEPMCLQETWRWTNYSLKATLKSANYDAIGLMFRYVDAGNYYRFSNEQKL